MTLSCTIDYYAFSHTLIWNVIIIILRLSIIAFLYHYYSIIFVLLSRELTSVYLCFSHCKGLLAVSVCASTPLSFLCTLDTQTSVSVSLLLR